MEKISAVAPFFPKRKSQKSPPAKNKMKWNIEMLSTHRFDLKQKQKNDHSQQQQQHQQQQQQQQQQHQQHQQ